MSNPFTQPNIDELPRDQWGRPLITAPGGGASSAYTRASTLGKVLDDTYHLNQWAARMVALGMSKRPDLTLRASAINDPDDRGQKKTLQDIANRAKDSAAPSKAELGSALHQYTERIDSGEPLTIVPELYRGDMVAYTRTREVHGLDVVSMETFIVNDEDQVAGSYDRVYRLTRALPVPRDLTAQLIESRAIVMDDLPPVYTSVLGELFLNAGTHVIGDIKTGSSVVLAAGSFAIQLGSYANGRPYSHTTGSRWEHPKPFCRDLAVVMHMPAGRSVCTMHWLNIRTGYVDGLPLTVRVRQWRAQQKSLIVAASNPDMTPAQPNAVPIDTLIDGAQSVAELGRIYHANREEWTPRLTQVAAARKAQLTK